MRRLLIVLGALLGVLLIAMVLIPFWLGTALGSLGPRFGVSFARYERIGYSRFALYDVTFRRATIKADIARVELAAPLVWLSQRVRGKGASIIADQWKVELVPTSTPARIGSADEGGWMSSRKMVREAVAQIEPWIDAARLGSGTVRWPGGSAGVAGIEWSGRQLSLRAATYQAFKVDAEVAVPAAADELRVSGRINDGEATGSLVSRGANVEGQLTLWNQPAMVSARFKPKGWLPEEAAVVAADWTLPGAKLKLGDSYQSAQGTARITWRDGNFTADVTGHGAPLEGHRLPPLDVALRAHGDLQTVTIEELRTRVPGVNADLSAPVAIDREGRIQGEPARLRFDVVLAEQPWFKASGTVTGTAQIVPATAESSRVPEVRFQIEARDVAAAGVAIASAAARGAFDSPRLRLESATLQGSDGTHLSLGGEYDIKARAVVSAAVEGEISRTTVARWLPPQLGFTTVKLEAHAEGALPDIRHHGSMRVADVMLSGVKPLKVAGSWSGAGRTLEKFSAEVQADDTVVTAGGSVGQDAVRLTELEFSPGGASALRLQQPATLRWSPQMQLESLQLAGPDARVMAAVTWGKKGRLQLSVQGAKSEWLADFMTLPGPAWQLSSLAVTGTWEDGPMDFAAVVGASIALDARRSAVIHLDARGGREGVRLAALRAEADGNDVVNANGFFPATITPGTTQLIKVDQKSSFTLNATTAENADFWREIGALTGLTVTNPQVVARLEGTLDKPQGELQVKAERVTFDEKRFARPIPAVEHVNAQVKGTPAGVVLDTFSLTIAGQNVTAQGQLPVTKDGWEGLRKDPRQILGKGAELRIRIPDSDLARFKDVLPEVVVPKGRLNVDVALRDGKLSGSLRLADAATRPLGPAGALQDIAAEIQFNGQTIEIRSVSAQTGGETVRLSGRIEVPDVDELRAKKAAAAGSLKYDLRVEGNNLPFVRTTGLLVRGDIDLKLTTPDAGTPEVTGSVRLRESLFLQDVRSLVPGGTRSKKSRPPYFAVETEPFNAWRLNIAVAGSEFMRLSATGFSGMASAQFQLGGTLGDPLLLGDATIDRGQVKFPFANFKVDEGRVSLSRADPHEPQIWVVATTRRYEFDLKLEVSGPASNPEVKFDSTPHLEHGQVLQMVVAGIVPRSDVTVTQTKRVQNLGAFIGQNLLSSFGEGDDSERLTITSGEDISERGRETYGFEFKLDDRWSLTGEYDQYDTHTVGAKWRALTRGGRGVALAGSTDSEEARAERGDGGERPKPAKLDVRGLGFWGNLEMEASLRRLIGKERRSAMDTNAVEDSVFLLMSSIKEKGYLKPTVELTITQRDGQDVPLAVGADLDATMPRPLMAQRVTFDVDRGHRSLVKAVDFTGLRAIRTKRARRFFAGEPGLFTREASRIYTPARIARGAENLAAELHGLGYAEARVNAERVRSDGATGEVQVEVQVNEGPRWTIAAVRVEGAHGAGVTLPDATRHVGKPWTESLQQDIAAELRNAFLAAGYPDVRVRMSHSEPEMIEGTDEKRVAVTARVEPGPAVTLGRIRYQGLVKTRPSVLDRRIKNEPGEPLNLLELERARYRISRLGVFRRVEVEFEPEDGTVRDAVFRVEPGRRLELNLLAGYNTYEQLRVGAEVRQYNVWGRAHQTRGLLVQSMKSTRGEYAYTVPELFGENVHGTARVYGLHREEVAFLRQEYGIKLAIDTPLRFLGVDANAGYTFEVLRNKDNQLETSALDRSQVEVASVDGTLMRDRRDNSLLPRKGYRVYGRAEAASPMLGGNAEYQRFEIGGSYHVPWGDDRWWHFAATHGVITTFGRNDEQLPVNKRFFPGGDGSIRGYNNGEAAPRGRDGRFIGAKSFVNASVEFEHALVESLSGVVFVDGLGMAAQLADYPFHETLFAAGLGVRYRTVVGPIRAEYGYNLNRRAGDPVGTFLFSIGFPF